MDPPKDKPTLPVVNPAVEPNTPDPDAASSESSPESTAESTPPRRSCRSCCGCKCFGGHLMTEVGLSRWVPWWVLLLTRLASFFIMMTLAIVQSFNVFFYMGPDINMVVLYTLSVSFLVLAICTGLTSRGSTLKILPNIAVPFHQSVATYSIISAVMGFFSPLPLYMGFGVVPIAFVLLDSILLQATIHFRWGYCWLPTIPPAFYFAIFGGVFSGYWILAPIYIGYLIGVAGTSLILTLISRLNLARLFRKNREEPTEELIEQQGVEGP